MVHQSILVSPGNGSAQVSGQGLPGATTADAPAPQPAIGAGILPRGGRFVVGLGCSLLALVFIAALTLASQLHRRVIVDAEREISTLALILAAYTENTFRAMARMQDALAETIEAMGIDGVEGFNASLSTQAVNLDLHGRIAGVPQVEAAFLTNAEGVTVASTRAWPQRVFSIADRPHFAMLRDHPELQSYIAPPARNVQTGTWNLYLTRRLTDANGGFLGVVGVGLGIPSFETFLGRIAPGPQSSIVIWNRDGTLLMRFPAISASGPGQSPLTSPAIAAARHDGTIRRATSVVDGRALMIAGRDVPGFPIVVTVSRAESEILDLWLKQAAYIVVSLAVLTMVVLGIILLGIRHLRNRDQLEGARIELRVWDEHRRGAAQIAFLAHHDPLTGLANRSLFQEKLSAAIAGTAKGNACALLFLDLDHFKDVNDTLGHPIGDRLLQAVAVRLQAHLRATDTLARLGGDEFAIVQTGMSHPDDTSSLAQRLVDAICAPFDIDHHYIVIGTSMGIAVVPGDGLDSEQLVKNADMALYRAKAAGRGGYCFFEPEMNDHAQMRRTLHLELRRALEQNEFELHYQVQVDMKTRRMVGFEALLRWRHPTQGLIMPDRFISVAEEIGLIVPLGGWVIRKACSDAAGWPAGTRLSINLSALQFGSGHLVAVITDALAASGLDPADLELEITETVLLRDTDATMATLHRFRALGISIALDDFGTGYSSLGYLQRFPFDRVKIDRSFVASLGHAKTSYAIVQAVIGLCRALDMSITAEGVETEEQFCLLRDSGCEEAQGYLLGRPSPVEGLPMERRSEASPRTLR